MSLSVYQVMLKSGSVNYGSDTGQREEVAAQCQWEAKPYSRQVCTTLVCSWQEAEMKTEEVLSSLIIYTNILGNKFCFY